MLMRILMVVAVVAMMNVYAAGHIIGGLDVAAAHPVAAWFCALLFFLLQMAGPFGSRTFFGAMKAHKATRWLVYPLYWTSYVAFAAMSVLVVYGLLIDLLSLFWYAFAVQAEHAEIRENAFIVLCGLTFATVALGVFQVWTGPVVKRVAVKIKDLPAGLEGFTIVQLSDLHIGTIVNKRYVSRVVKMANALKPDMVALTGDIVDGDIRELSAALAPLAGLITKNGTYYVTGNHEYYWDHPAILAAMRVSGAHVLENRHVVITRGPAKLVVAGVNDISTRGLEGDIACNPEKALKGAPISAPRILLAHQPVTYRLAEKLGVDLQLSGHTHAGQYFPFTFLIRFFQKYYKGLNRHVTPDGGTMQIYVNAGTGFWGPPLRAGAPAEVTLLTLKQG